MSVSESNPPTNVLVVVTDGLGYDARFGSEVLASVLTSLDPSTSALIHGVIEEHFGKDVDWEDACFLTLAPRIVEGIDPSTRSSDAQSLIDIAIAARQDLRAAGAWDEIVRLRIEAARRLRHVPWALHNPEWDRIVNSNLTVPTHASGVWVGYEDVDPPVQGNSETGHQQIGNLALAPQIPLEISRSIETGSFFRNAHLRTTVENALDNDRNVNFCFLLSGVRGSDGRVHSAWNHLEAFCDLVFEDLGAPPHRVRMQAILDGRDAPAHGSLGVDGLDGGYIDYLERLLAKHGAVESLAWVIGRSIAMDRDYREENARTDFLQLTTGEGEIATDFTQLRELIADAHATGLTDADVPPIVMSPPEGVRVIERGDAFVNLNFRSDRQRAKTASLCGGEAYLKRHASARGRTWSMDWMRDDLDLDICTIAEYDAEFEAAYGVKVAYPISPHRLSFLSNWDRLMPVGSRYLLVAESVKSSHMGYFVRGRREIPECEEAEERRITPSLGQKEGVRSDSDFYLKPEMRTQEIVDDVTSAMEKQRHRLIMCNLAAPDMIGHLLPTRFEEAVEAYATTAKALAQLAAIAQEKGYALVVTSDHGNIENDAPTHTVNPVLTTIVPVGKSAKFSDSDGPFVAALFDLSPTIAKLLGVDPTEIQRVVAENSEGLEERFIGRSMI